jgi:eukaryotic-like serine/threonine-protein kinase
MTELPSPPQHPAISRSQRLFLPVPSRESARPRRNPEAVDSLQTLVVPGADTLVLGRYRLHERLGAGGFGVVWSAYDEQLHREVAVKRIWLQGSGPRGSAPRAGRTQEGRIQAGRTQGSSERAEHAERATREAQATARLSHPAIVALYEAQAEDDAFYLISELVHGETLGSVLADGECSDEEVLAIGVALSAALEHAHARGVVHRDVKPHNILVPYDCEDRAAGIAKLTDFGGALLAGEDVLTRTGDVLGTLAYMAPEQSEGREASAQSDLYSLALVLYEALSGVNPVRGANPADTARRIGGRLPPLRRYRRDLPPECGQALDTALAPDPRQRGTLSELRHTFEELLARGLHESSPRASAARPTHQDAATATAQWPEYQETLGGPPPWPADRRSPRAPTIPAAPAAVPARAAAAAPAREPEPSPGRPLLLPRTVWLTAAVALIAWQSVAGHPGLALLALAAVAPLLIPRRTPVGALGAALSPALGTIGLAGVFPAVAGQASVWRTRALVGALGYWWLCLAEPLTGTRLWLGPPDAALSYPGGRAAWEGSLDGAFNHVLVPLLGAGVLLGAALWALAALVLPWLVRGRHAALDLVMATMWTAALLTAEPLLDHGLPLASGQAMPRGALPAALLAGALAVGARALRGPV